LAGYRPIGLSSASSSTIIAGRATSYADRRRAAAERLSKTADITRRIEAVVSVPAPDVVSEAPIDPDGTLRASIRALLPVAHRSEGFDVTVSLGPDHWWAARIRKDGDGVSAEIVPGTGRGPGRIVFAEDESRVASELATLLWSGEVTCR
jgi:hypothetical protein